MTRYLLDVGALIAFGVKQHQFHGRVAGWMRSQTGSIFLSCSITELGFVRILSNTPAYGFTVLQARTLLLELKKDSDYPIRFLSDGNDITFLPSWVWSPGQTTDGHLAQLARSNDAALATLDRGIHDTFLIP